MELAAISSPAPLSAANCCAADTKSAWPSPPTWSASSSRLGSRQSPMGGSTGGVLGRGFPAQVLEDPGSEPIGKTHVVGFRWACDKQLRDAVCDFANDSRHANPWAADIYNRAIARKKDHPHAVRILARAWLYVIWRCWQANTAYDRCTPMARSTALEGCSYAWFPPARGPASTCRLRPHQSGHP